MAAFNCSKCDYLIEVDEVSGTIGCDRCGALHPLIHHLCPACHNYSDRDVAICPQCGEATSKVCANCETANWSGNEFCEVCGASIDMVVFVGQHSAAARQSRRQKDVLRIEQLKRMEEAASQKRMAELMAAEERRQAEVNRHLQKLKRRERRTLIIFLGGAAIILLIIFLLILLT